MAGNGRLLTVSGKDMRDVREGPERFAVCFGGKGRTGKEGALRKESGIALLPERLSGAGPVKRTVKQYHPAILKRIHH